MSGEVETKYLKNQLENCAKGRKFVSVRYMIDLGKNKASSNKKFKAIYFEKANLAS